MYTAVTNQTKQKNTMFYNCRRK